jgi:hypothetical protein
VPFPGGTSGSRCGFPDPYHFSKTFKHIAGIPPIEYRRMYRQEKVSVYKMMIQDFQRCVQAADFFALRGSVFSQSGGILQTAGN